MQLYVESSKAIVSEIIPSTIFYNNNWHWVKQVILIKIYYPL